MQVVRSASGEALADCLRQESLPPALRAALLVLPSESELALSIWPLNPGDLHSAREGLLGTLAQTLREPCEPLYERYCQQPYSTDSDKVGERTLRNAALQVLALAGGRDASSRVWSHFRDADNLTDRLAALQALAGCDEEAFHEALARFHAQWRHEPLALDKWFSIQARTVQPWAMSRIVALAQHADFNRRNPDRLRALVETLALENPAAFHAPDGSGHAFMAEQILAVDRFNPIVAARLMDCFADWRRYVSPLRESLHAQLQRIAAAACASPNVAERATTAIAAEFVPTTTAENAK